MSSTSPPSTIIIIFRAIHGTTVHSNGSVWYSPFSTVTGRGNYRPLCTVPLCTTVFSYIPYWSVPYNYNGPGRPHKSYRPPPLARMDGTARSRSMYRTVGTLDTAVPYRTLPLARTKPLSLSNMPLSSDGGRPAEYSYDTIIVFPGQEGGVHANPTPGDISVPPPSPANKITQQQ